LILYRRRGLRGLELWHGVARGGSLDQMRGDKAAYFAGLREFLTRLHCGTAESRDASDTKELRVAAGFRHVVFCGGEALHPLLGQSLDAQPLPFSYVIDKAGAYAAGAGARAIFEEMGWRCGVALDLGQVRLKVIADAGRCCVSRDETLLPYGASAIDAALGVKRLREMIREGLRRGERILGARADGVVLGLPAAIDEKGIARPASYPGLEGSVEQIFGEVSGTAPWVVLNDAVLAARGFPPVDGEKKLVVTLGFGVGGALWEP
jgi:hypothetical protein